MLAVKRRSTIINLLALVGIFFSFQTVFAAVPDEVQAIFNNSCLTGCHDAANQRGGLNLDNADVSETSLVDVTAICNNNEKLVVPGEPENSILYLKLFANTTCGQPMPLGAPLLSDNDRNIISGWIVSIGPAAQFGMFSMNDANVTVQETDTDVTIVVNREFGTTGEVTIDFDVTADVGDSAESPTDFVEQLDQTLTFANGETVQQITVTLADDGVFEGSETFSVTLKEPTTGGAVLGVASQTKVSITDDEFDNQPGTFFFGRVSYSAAEDAGDMEVMIIRSFGAAGQVSVDVNSSDGLALSNSDFQTVNSTLVFEEGIKNLTFNVAIIDDAIEEATEAFTLSLSNPGNGALLGAPQSVSVTITDNDGNGGGDDGGGDDGGGDGGDGGGSDGGDAIPEEEAEFEAAGAIMYLLPLLLIFGFLRRKILS